MTDVGQIVEVKGYPTPFPLPAGATAGLRIGRPVKQDAFSVKVLTESDLVGYSEFHHRRAPGAVAHLISTALRKLEIGMDALDAIGIWKHIYKMQPLAAGQYH